MCAAAPPPALSPEAGASSAAELSLLGSTTPSTWSKTMAISLLLELDAAGDARVGADIGAEARRALALQAPAHGEGRVARRQGRRVLADDEARGIERPARR